MDRAVFAAQMMLRFARSVEDLGSFGKKGKLTGDLKWTLS